MAYKDWPKHALKVIVLLACTTAVIFQLSECIMKLCYPPVSTHTELDLNATMSYPAITVCRNPPYKPEVLLKHGLNLDIRLTSEWIHFPWNTTTLTAFWNEATYMQNETFAGYGLEKSQSNVNITSNFYFEWGRCHTLRPLTTTQIAGSAVGYSLTLRHTSRYVPHQLPWQIYIHQSRDKYTENNVQTAGMQELVVLPVGEEGYIKLTVSQLRRVNHPKAPCRSDYTYSAMRCEEQCRWNEISQAEGCSVPWMPGTGLPECNTYNSTTNIIKEYLRYTRSATCKAKCEKPCHANHFSAYIVNRGSVDNYLPITFSQCYIFHASKLVTSVREHYDYNLSRFIADAGGSLGFLLGVSVLSLVGLLCHALHMLVTCGSSKKLGSNGKAEEQDTTSEAGSDSTSVSNGSIRSKETMIADEKYFNLK